jgi:energy-coupling factor transporter ATP-binding protein EcfA2
LHIEKQSNSKDEQHIFSHYLDFLFKTPNLQFFYEMVLKKICFISKQQLKSCSQQFSQKKILYYGLLKFKIIEEF